MRSIVLILLVLFFYSMGFSENTSLSVSIDYPNFFGDNYLSQYSEYYGVKISFAKNVISLLNISSQVDYLVAEWPFVNTKTFLNGFTPSLSLNIRNKLKFINLEFGVGIGLPIYNFNNAKYNFDTTYIGIEQIVQLKFEHDLNSRLSLGFESIYSYLNFNKTGDIPYNTRINLWQNGLYIKFQL